MCATRPSPQFWPGRRREGRALTRPEDRHGGGADHPSQATPVTPSAIRTLNGAKPAPRLHPQRRVTGNGTAISTSERQYSTVRTFTISDRNATKPYAGWMAVG